MALLKPFSKLPILNTANVLNELLNSFLTWPLKRYLCNIVYGVCAQLVENEEQLQQKLADSIVLQEKNVNVIVRLARSLPLPVENEERRPRIDLVVFIVHLESEHSLLSTEKSLKHLNSGYFLGKVCFLVTGARCGSVPHERLASLKKLAASLHCPLLSTESQTTEGVNTAALRVLNILKVSAGLVPMTTGLYLSTLTRCTFPPDPEWHAPD